MSSKVNRRRFLKYAGVVAGAAAIGGYYFYQSSTPGPSGWSYVALGDSWTLSPCGTSYVAYYAGHIEADLGVKVRPINEGKNDLSSDELLSRLRNYQWLRDEISEAKVVTFLIGGGNALPFVLSAGIDPFVPDIQKALAPWRGIFDAVIDEILSLRSTSDTIIRTIAYPNPWVGLLKKQGIFDQVKPNIAAWSEQIVEAASKHNIPVARADLAWNGPNGDEDPVPKGYIGCGDPYAPPARTVVHPSDAGNRVIAEVLRKLGYKPLGP